MDKKQLKQALKELKEEEKEKRKENWKFAFFIICVILGGLSWIYLVWDFNVNGFWVDYVALMIFTFSALYVVSEG